jgi:hypothetical protein
MTPTIVRALVGIQLAAYHILQMSVARVREQEIFRTSSVIGTLVIGSRTIAKTEIVPSTSAIMRGTMSSMTPTTTSPLDVVLRTEDIMKEESKLSTVISGG